MPWSGLAAVAVCVSRAAIAALIEHEQMAAVLDRDDGVIASGLPISQMSGAALGGRWRVRGVGAHGERPRHDLALAREGGSPRLEQWAATLPARRDRCACAALHIGASSRYLDFYPWWPRLAIACTPTSPRCLPPHVRNPICFCALYLAKPLPSPGAVAEMTSYCRLMSSQRNATNSLARSPWR
jgi:hypothetical protein